MAAGGTPKQTLAGAVADRMRSDILSGRLRPADRLMFPDLCKQYGASVGVTREALASLVAQGLVVAQPHQGYKVRTVSTEDLVELTATRIAFEPVVLRLSIANGDVEWESRVIAAHHVLARTTREPPDNPLETTDEWVLAHEAFHAELFSGCTNGRLIGFTRGLAEEAALYRRWSVPFESDRDVAGEHAAIVEATIVRDVELACERLCAHITLTARLLLEHTDELPVG